MKSLILFFFASKVFATCYFIPPSNWDYIDPNILSKHVVAGFVKSGSATFRPSINLAHEKTTATTFEYIKAIEKLHENDKKSIFRNLGKITTHAGDATLLQITKNTSFGEICLLQTVLLQNANAYIITGAVLKNEFSKYKNEFMQVFKSLKITSDLLSEIKDPEKKTSLLQKYKNIKENPKEFEKYIIENFNDLGNYWKILITKQAYETK